MSEADPDKLFRDLLSFKCLLIFLSFLLTDLSKMITEGRKYFVPSKTSMDLPSGSVSSNMESYLARTPVDEDDDTLDAQRILVYLIMMITFVNLTFTYLFIHLVLKFKHSEAIKIAEKTTSNTKGNLISFKMLNITTVLMIIPGLINFCIYQTHSYTDFEQVPPVHLLINIATALYSVFFVLSKCEVLAFVRRRWRGFVQTRSYLAERKNRVAPAPLQQCGV